MSNRGFFSIDWALLVPAVVLVVMGLTTLFSINSSFFVSQLFFVFLSFIAFLVFSHINYKILELYKTPIYIISILFLLFILILGIESRGAVRWIDFLGIRIQFSEILKPFLLISMASFLANGRNNSFNTFIMFLIFLFPIAFLIFMQPDLGNALIYVGVSIITLIIFGFPWLWFIIFGIGTVVMLPIFWQFLHDYQRQRILTFFRPSSDPLGTSYNAIQAIIAVGSGMFFGKGLGQATQSVLRFLPERQTDFIFATLSESFGFVGGTVVILAFIFLLYRIFAIYSAVDDTFRKVFCIGAFLLIGLQSFVNIGMNIGLSPVVGVTLPFVSYGGSSIISSFILLGILSSISANLKHKDVLEIR